jgi:hypothetical protein
MKDRLEAALTRALHGRIDGIDVPPPDIERIAARHDGPAPVRSQWRRHAITLAAGAAIGAAVYATGAQVSAVSMTVHDRIRASFLAMEHFLGVPMEHRKIDIIDYKESTLAAVRHEVPFPVVTPATLPTGFHLRSVSLGDDRSVELIFTKGGRLSVVQPGIHVIESASQRLSGPSHKIKVSALPKAGFSMSVNPDGSIRATRQLDAARFSSSTFNIGGTRVDASFINLDNPQGIAREFRAAMTPGQTK